MHRVIFFPALYPSLSAPLARSAFLKNTIITMRRTQGISLTHRHFRLYVILLRLYIPELAEILEKFGITVNFFADYVKLYVKIMNDVDVCVLREAVDALVDGQKSGNCPFLLISVVCSILANVFPVSLFLLTVHCYHMLLRVVI